MLSLIEKVHYDITVAVWTKDMVKVVFFVGLRRSRARVGTGGVESDDRGITRELVSPSLGETESWIGVVQFVQSQPRDVGLSDSDIY